MAGRFVAVAGGLLLLAGGSAFVAERAGWFDPSDLRDALPGVEAPDGTIPADQAEEAAPKPETRPPETAVARPERKPAPDALAPARKPDFDAAPRTRTAESAPAADGDAQPAARDAPAEPTDETADGGAPETGDAPAAAETDGVANGGSADDASDTPAAPEPATDDSDTERASTQPADTTEPADPGRQTQADDPDTDTEQPAERARASAPRAEPEGPADSSTVRDPDSGMQLTVPAREDEAEAPAGASVAKVPAPQVPSFDIVRVERSGEAVIAGRAAPRSRVTVLQGDRPIATAEADDRGEFVAIPHRPLPPGQRQLTLRAEDPESGETAESDRAVVIDIPRMPADDTPEAAQATRTADRAAQNGQGGAQVAVRTPSGQPPESAATEADDAASASEPTRETATDPAATVENDGDASEQSRQTVHGAQDGDAAPDRTRQTVAVRDNVPTAEPPLLTDPPEDARARENARDRPNPRAGGDSQTAGDALTIPAPPEGAAQRDAPPATVTDVPEPPGAGPEVTTRTAEAGPEDGPQVSVGQDGAAPRDGADRTATRAMRPRAAAPPDARASLGDGGETGRSAASPNGAGADTSGGDAPIAVLVPREGTGEVEVLQRPSGETGLADRKLVLEAVQYTVDGGISISGQAPAEAMVVAFLNETELARVRTPADGNWTMAPEADVPPGLHTLRVDQLGPDGDVQASVSTPFANQPMVDDLDENEGMVVIQPGDNLWTIARRTYGQGWEYTLIYRANRDQIRDPDLIYPGQVFVVPEEQRREAGGAN